MKLIGAKKMRQKQREKEGGKGRAIKNKQKKGERQQKKYNHQAFLS
jgi:hypothetical protein